MSDADIDVNSLVGGASALYVTIDTFEWGRNALSLVGLSDAQFDRLAAQLGGAVAAEVLLLMVSKRCGDNENQWEEAAALGEGSTTPGARDGIIDRAAIEPNSKACSPV